MPPPNSRKPLSRKISKRIRLSILFLPVLLFAVPKPVDASAAVRVFLAGESSTVRPALELAGGDAIVFVEDANSADVILLNGVIPGAEAVRTRLEEGAGLVLILGPDISASDFTGLCGVPVAFTRTDEPASLVAVPIDDPLRRQIVWNGAPQVRERNLVVTPISSV